MHLFVENGLAGCRLAVDRRAVAVVVDALRASATVASLFHHGAQRVIVVRRVEEAFAQRDRSPDAVLVGERGGPMVPGFDLGNSALQAPPDIPLRDVIFSSSNCSRCCVGLTGAAAAFLGATINAAATARAVLEACRTLGTDQIVLVTAGSVEDESLLTIEDHLAAGAIIAACAGLAEQFVPANDRAEVCRLLYADGDQSVLTQRFMRSTNGASLTALGLGADVEFASRLDVFHVVPRIAEALPLAHGGRGALLTKA